MSIIAFRIALTLDVKIAWFGCQVVVCVQKWHKNAIFWCSWFQKFNFSTVYCLSSWFVHQQQKTYSNFGSFVESVIYHDFSDQRIFHRLFGLKSKIMTLSRKFQKRDFLGHCSFTQLFHDVKKLRRKPKIFVKVIQRFWYVQHVGLIFLKIHQKQPKLQLW